MHGSGVFTEDTAIWKEELQRHCEEVYEDVEATIEKQEDRIKEYKTKGNRHITEEGRFPEFTIDLVLQARAKMPEGLNGMVQRIPL